MADVDVKSTSTNTVDVVGLNDLKAGITLALAQPFKTEGSNTYEIKPLEIKPLTTTSTNTYDIKPLKTDSSVALDLKPAVVDFCLTLNVGKVPSVCIRQPYRHRVGFTLYGFEVWAFSFSGEQETITEELAPRPQVSVGGPGHAWPPAAVPHGARAAHTQGEQPEANAREVQGGGLRIRLGS